jgi:hypothetical protein
MYFFSIFLIHVKLTYIIEEINQIFKTKYFVKNEELKSFKYFVKIIFKHFIKLMLVIKKFIIFSQKEN